MARSRSSLDVNRVVQGVLFAGVVSSVTLIVVGLLLLAFSHTPHRSAVLPIRQAVREALQLRPTAWLDLGIFVLMLTPIVRVLAALVVYARERDFRYVLVSLIVLAILTLSVALGRGG